LTGKVQRAADHELHVSAESLSWMVTLC